MILSFVPAYLSVTNNNNKFEKSDITEPLYTLHENDGLRITR